MFEAVSVLKHNSELASAVAAIASSVVAAVAIVVSIWALRIQRHHNVLSLRPLPMIEVEDYEDRLAVTLKNDGPGPLTLKRIRVTADKTEKDSIIDWMPELPSDMFWRTFVGAIAHSRSIPANGHLRLVEFGGDHRDERYVRHRDACRERLSRLSVAVDYTDVYGSLMAPAERNLSWFGREH
jgi:hypothetical protein